MLPSQTGSWQCGWKLKILAGDYPCDYCEAVCSETHYGHFEQSVALDGKDHAGGGTDTTADQSVDLAAGEGAGAGIGRALYQTAQTLFELVFADSLRMDC